MTKNFTIIPKISDVNENEKQESSILGLAIENKDMIYIQKHLRRVTKADIKILSKKQKIKFASICADLTPGIYKKPAIDCIYMIVDEVGHISELSRKLIKIAHDFGKLFYLRGKILALKSKAKEERLALKPENKYKE